MSIFTNLLFTFFIINLSCSALPEAVAIFFPSGELVLEMSEKERSSLCDVRDRRMSQKYNMSPEKQREFDSKLEIYKSPTPIFLPEGYFKRDSFIFDPNQNPNPDKMKFYMTKETPADVWYELPLQDYDWSVVDWYLVDSSVLRSLTMKADDIDLLLKDIKDCHTNTSKYCSNLCEVSESMWSLRLWCRSFFGPRNSSSTYTFGDLTIFIYDDNIIDVYVKTKYRLYMM